ncbi:hypothetical protein BURK2_01238 [Burkholderiales bacterium]|nr:MAG: hypothetical protein F9K47_06475 [Burkholderiales bacterium]CAG0970233.1 hypothetical protein BURK2_01238 [Burkholderiales bacterium]
MLRSVVALCALLLFGAAPAQALVQRAYVSALTGNDANTATNCPATAPCRWFAGAISVVTPGGEIVAMDSGAYGTVTITKSISIVSAPGAYAGITVFSGNGVTIASAGLTVVLRGLTINSLGGDYGIAVTAGAALSVENCVVSNFSLTSGAGLYVNAPAEVAVVKTLFRGNYDGVRFSGGAKAQISDSQFLRNTVSGVLVDSSAGATEVSAERVVSSGNGSSGFVASATAGSASLAIKSALASENGSHGIGGSASASGAVAVNVSKSLSTANGLTGVFASGDGARVVVSSSTITRNAAYGLYQASSAVFMSTGDNRVSDNAVGPSSGTISSLTPM